MWLRHQLLGLRPIILAILDVVVAGLDPAIHSATLMAAAGVPEWMPWSSHGMTTILEPLL
jgi:hypothetical protein